MTADGDEPELRPEEEEEVYESDPDDQLLPLRMRRREASDDESDNGREKSSPRRVDRRVSGAFDCESDGEGEAHSYEEEEVCWDDGELLEEGCGDRKNVGGGEVCGNQEEGEEGEKKENNSFVTPTVGAFFMHDDRFRGSRGGRRQSHIRRGQRLWESKDNQAWVHDRFQEMNIQDQPYNEESRVRKGHYRGQGRRRGIGRGNRFQSYDDRSRAYDDRFDDYGKNQSQNPTSKIVRGRGPRRYKSYLKNRNNRKDFPDNRTKPTKKSHGPTSYTIIQRQSLQSSSDQVDQQEPAIPRNQTFNSSLNSASPPFYPSGSSIHDSSIMPNRDIQNYSVGRTVSSSISDSTLLKGNTLFGYLGNQEKTERLLQIDSSHHHIPVMSTTNVNVFEPFPLPYVGTTQSPQLRFQDSSPSLLGGQKSQKNSLQNQVPNMSSVQQRPSGSGTSASHNFQVKSANVSVSEDSDSPSELSKLKVIVAGREKMVSQIGGRATFLYNGSQFIGHNGTMALPHGDQNFPGTPALLPVMQIPAQPNGGVPAVGVALPGFVAQPQLGFEDSEMAWLPMLAGAFSGALGSSYAPYITLDGGYHPKKTGTTSSSLTPNEMNSCQPNNLVNTSQRSAEQENSAAGQRQNKPRIYSEMNFAHD